MVSWALGGSFTGSTLNQALNKSKAALIKIHKNALLPGQL